MAVACGIVDDDAGLHVVAEDVEADALSTVFYGHGLHLNAAGHQVVPLEDGGIWSP